MHCLIPKLPSLLPFNFQRRVLQGILAVERRLEEPEAPVQGAPIDSPFARYANGIRQSDRDVPVAGRASGRSAE